MDLLGPTVAMQENKGNLPSAKRRGRVGCHDTSPSSGEHAGENDWINFDRSPKISKIAGGKGG
jgi:hypothetical protein